jgi:hypothetical protein
MSGCRKSVKLVSPFVDRGLSRGQRNISLWLLMPVFWTATATFLWSSSSFILMRLSERHSRPTTSQKFWQRRESKLGPLNPCQELWPLDHTGGPLNIIFKKKKNLQGFVKQSKNQQHVGLSVARLRYCHLCLSSLEASIHVTWLCGPHMTKVRSCLSCVSATDALEVLRDKMPPLFQNPRNWHRYTCHRWNWQQPSVGWWQCFQLSRGTNSIVSVITATRLRFYLNANLQFFPRGSLETGWTVFESRHSHT